MTNLKELNLAFNQFKSIKLFKINVESIDLSDNFIEHIKISDFNFSSNLKSINLNRNNIKFIENSSFDNLQLLNSLQLAENPLEFYLSAIKQQMENFIKLDLSSIRVILDCEIQFDNLKFLIIKVIFTYFG